METTLLAVTVLSLVLAALMGVMLVRMAREERRRSDARVALLEQLANGDAPAVTETPGAARRRFVQPATATGRIGTSPTAEAIDLDLRPAEGHTSVYTVAMFQPEVEPTAWWRRSVVIGVMALLLFAGMTTWRSLSTDRRAVAAPPLTTVRPLELLSLSHSQEPGVLIVQGLVQNPRNSGNLSGVHATVQMFDQSGALVASGRAPLDFSSLAAGDESPFVIRTAVTGAVARYRVGFRASDDRVVAHVDRRGTDPLARKQVP